MKHPMRQSERLAAVLGNLAATFVGTACATRQLQKDLAQLRRSCEEMSVLLGRVLRGPGAPFVRDSNRELRERVARLRRRSLSLRAQQARDRFRAFINRL